MKISAYIAALVAQGLTEDAARGLAKGQAAALALVDDVGLTKPLASGLVKGLVDRGMTEADATDVIRVSIAKGSAVDDLAATPAAPETADDAIAQLEAASEVLAKGGKPPAPAEEDELDSEDDDDEDGDEDGVDGDEDEPMPPPRRGARKGSDDVAAYAALMKGAVEETSARLDTLFAALNARVDDVAKGVGAQGKAFVQLCKGMTAQSDAVLGLAKSLGVPRGPRSAQDAQPQPHPSELAGVRSAVERSTLAMRALTKGATAATDSERNAFNDFQGLINSTADDATIQAAAVKLGLA